MYVYVKCRIVEREAPEEVAVLEGEVLQVLLVEEPAAYADTSKGAKKKDREQMHMNDVTEIEGVVVSFLSYFLCFSSLRSFLWPLIPFVVGVIHNVMLIYENAI